MPLRPKSSSGTIEKLKLNKLVYLMERRALKTYRRPILYDEFFSLPHGPICSSTLNCIDGLIYAEVCDQYMVRNGNVLMALHKYSRDIYDELSDADISMLNQTWEEFGALSSSQLRNYTHMPENVPEYIEVPAGNRAQITYEAVLKAVGREDAREGAEFIESMRRLESALSR